MTEYGVVSLIKKPVMSSTALYCVDGVQYLVFECSAYNGEQLYPPVVECLVMQKTIMGYTLQ